MPAAAGVVAVEQAKVAAQDLLDVGAYKPGTNPRVDAAVANEDAINRFLRQGIGEPSAFADGWARLNELVAAMPAAGTGVV